MWRNNTLDNVICHVLDRKLGKAVDALENYLLTNQQQADMEQLQLIKNDYQLMADYWRKGYSDPERQKLYEQLLRRLYVLVANMITHDRLRHSSYLMTLYQRPRTARNDWTLAAIRQSLEGYVSDVAMLSLEPEHTRQQKTERLHREHQQQMGYLFDYITTSRQWKESLASAFEEMLLSPTIDTTDQQLVVSAITLSAMNAFDIEKFRLLTRIYQLSTDTQLRQRALVGWVLSADAGKVALYPEMRETVCSLCQSEETRQELTELQMQMCFCMSAEQDTEKIKNEIIPDLMRGQNLRITRQGIIEQDEDTTEDILHPDAAERNMERMEQSMRKMVDMQKQGADIYFAGFSQMKRFPFFNDISNWFVPFYTEHPGISPIWQQQKGHKMLHMVLRMGAFCDSDKYSFVLAFNQVLERFPQQMLQMIESGEAAPMPVGGNVAVEEQRQPAFVRRLYLQNLYRFFRIYPQRGEFLNPFSEQQSIFFTNPLFCETPLEASMTEMAAFLSKHHRSEEAIAVLRNMSDSHQDARYYRLLASLLLRRPDLTPATIQTAVELYRKAIEAEPHNSRALMGYARACFLSDDYDQALEAYRQLLALQPDNRSAQLNAAVCLTRQKHYEEALQLLYKLNYLDADDENVMRVLAWTLTADGKYEQARKHYDRLFSAAKPQSADLLNYGYCRWFSGDVAGAVDLLRQFLDTQKDTPFSIEQELTENEHDLILEHGISDTEIQLMLDSLQ